MSEKFILLNIHNFRHFDIWACASNVRTLWLLMMMPLRFVVCFSFRLVDDFGIDFCTVPCVMGAIFWSHNCKFYAILCISNVSLIRYWCRCICLLIRSEYRSRETPSNRMRAKAAMKTHIAQHSNIFHECASNVHHEQYFRICFLHLASCECVWVCFHFCHFSTFIHIWNRAIAIATVNRNELFNAHFAQFMHLSKIISGTNAA